jgi:diaminopimelate decarboxylase
MAGAGAEVASLGEMAVASHAGFGGYQRVFVGPGKTPEEIHNALAADYMAILVCTMPGRTDSQ